MKTNIKQWAEDHKYTIFVIGKAVITLGVNAAIIKLVYNQAYHCGYGDGTRFGSAVSARATRKALDPSEDDIQKVIDMLPDAEKEILAEYGKKG